MNRQTLNRRRLWWLIPALIAIIAFIGGVAGNLIAADLESMIDQYRFWVWAVFFIALVAAVWGAIWEYRRNGDTVISDVVQTADAVAGIRLRYLERIAEPLTYLSMSSLDPKFGDATTSEAERIRLADVYIDMDTKTQVRTDGEGEGKEEELIAVGRDTRPLSVLEALVRSQRMVLVGEPGGGKSTFVNYLVFCLASEGVDPSAGWRKRLKYWRDEWTNLMPVPVVLRDMAVWIDSTQPQDEKIGLLQSYLQYWLHTLGLNDCSAVLLQRIRTGQALLLFDGLDEVPANITPRIRDMLLNLPKDWPTLVTCRVLSYEDERWHLDENRWPRFELDKLNEEKIDGFIDAWYQQLKQSGEISNPEALSTKLKQAVRRPDLWRMAQNPLLLTEMALVHSHNKELPDERAALYEEVIKLLLVRWEAAKLDRAEGDETRWRFLLRQAELNDMDMMRELWKLAYDVHGKMGAKEDGDATADISKAELYERLKELDPEHDPVWAEAMLEVINYRSGLLVERKKDMIYSFPHRTFQEYLAGAYLSSLPKFTDEAVKLASEGAGWWEVILLGVGRLVHVSGDVEKPLVLVDELCPKDEPKHEDEIAWRNIWLAGQCLLEIGLTRAQRYRTGREASDRLRTHLTTLITHDLLEPRERAEAGSILSVIGDKRNFDEMVSVSAGEFLMGSTDQHVAEVIKEESESLFHSIYEREKPQHTVLVDDFRIGKYSVTNTQYAHFIEANPDHKAPNHWQDRQPPQELRNHPVVNVSWHDAVAYCQWLSQEKGGEYRLPTEAEWEKAARGPSTNNPAGHRSGLATNGLIYPWGNDFAPNKCNMGETGIGGTSPAGMFKAGASPYECLDMSGNVWEWCLSKYQPYPYKEGKRNVIDQTSDSRVLRGGSFIDIRRLVRCALRNLDCPDNRDDYIGFRVVSPGL